ncbi:MAG TPA: GAF domain-containing protein, partial [Candidatus Dormibacteraeota bacterium]
MPRLSVPLALFTGAATAILAGASLNVDGRTGETVLPALLVALLSFGAGVGFRWWKYALGVALAGLVLNFWTYHFNLTTPGLRINVAGELALAAGGMLSFLAYSRVNEDIHRRMEDLERLNKRLEEQHRVFLAATEDTTMQTGGLPELAGNTARQTGAAVCCYYLLSPEGTHFLPQAPGFGLGSLQPQPVDRRRQGDPVLTAIEANQEFFTSTASDLRSLFSLMSPDVRMENALVVPIRVGDNIGGFVLVANKAGGFSQDDRRLAMTLAMRAGQHLATLHAVALSKKEAERYALLNDLIKKASGLSFDGVLQLVLEGCGALVPRDSARIAIFGP